MTIDSVGFFVRGRYRPGFIRLEVVDAVWGEDSSWYVAQSVPTRLAVPLLPIGAPGLPGWEVPDAK